MLAARISELERLVSTLRHDMRGILTPVAIHAAVLAEHADPKVRVGAERILRAVDRATVYLKATYATVPATDRPARPDECLNCLAAPSTAGTQLASVVNAGSVA